MMQKFGRYLIDLQTAHFGGSVQQTSKENFERLPNIHNSLRVMVARPRFELGTQGFSVLCSTN